jgi:hypothetical protein
MSHAASPIALSPVPLPQGVQRARLLKTPSGVVAVLARTGRGTVQYAPAPVTLDSMDPRQPRALTTLFTVARMLAGLPQWDITADARTGAHLVIAEFGGATNSLSVHAGTDVTPLVPLSDSDDLLDPRFVRGAGAAGAITALAYDERVVLFRAEPGSGYAPADLLLAGTELDNAILLRTTDGPILLTRRMELGPQRGRFPGILIAHPLGADFAAAGAAFPVFGAERIFDFDADVTPAGIAVIATTASGFALARLSHGAQPLIEAQPHAAPLGPVSLVSEGATLHFAFLPPTGELLLGAAPA